MEQPSERLSAAHGARDPVLEAWSRSSDRDRLAGRWHGFGLI